MKTPVPDPTGEPAWLNPHIHEPNLATPTAISDLLLMRPDGSSISIAVSDLAALPQQSVDACYIISTGHGISGPFRFDGVRLADLLDANAVTAWAYADIVSVDGFGTRVFHYEIDSTSSRPILLALACNGEPLTLAQGLVRLIVPQENDDALRQIKWVVRIEVH